MIRSLVIPGFVELVLGPKLGSASRAAKFAAGANFARDAFLAP